MTMATIKEEYCSKDIYRLLKEKGFDGEIHTIFDEEGYTQPSITLQVAMRWLREAHNIIIEPTSVWNGKKWEYQLFIVTPQNADSPYYEHNPYSSYEECVETGIKYCLKNLI